MRDVLLRFLPLCLWVSAADAAVGDDSWTTRVLDGTFRAEGAAFGDLDGDGELDLVAGGSWYRGPHFREARAFRTPRAWDPAHYSDHFFDFVDDLDGDGRNDVLVVGFPGEAAHWFRNPGPDVDALWESQLVLASVDNESPLYVDLTGDGRRELVCQNAGRFGWAEPVRGDPTAPWTFRALSHDLGLQRFTHGLGVGDVDGDGRADLLERTGWWRQPESLAGDPPWTKHEAVFGTQGGAQMFAFDIDGDGDADVLSSLAAHGFGLAWYEQTRDAQGRIAFAPHPILGDSADDLPHGVCFAELHALALCDVDGDGLQDLVTGKRWWSHGAQGDPEPGAPAVVYAFRLVRGPDGTADFVPELVHADSGVGVDVAVARGAGGGEVAIAVSNKKGTFVHVRGGPAERSAAGARPRAPDGRELNLDFEDGTLGDWTAEGQAFAGQPVEGDAPAARGREASLHEGRFWIGGWERLGDGPTGTLTSAPWRVEHPFASFLVGGGAQQDTRVEILACGADGAPQETLYSTGGADFESMQRVVVDLSAHVGSLARVRLVDRGSGGWGHVNFDDLRLHAERPRFERPHGVPAILEPDPDKPAGLAPPAAAAAMSVPAGFRVELIAGEPDLHQPVALAFDSRGRLWVAEAFTYPQRAPEGEGRDDIVVFEDRDGDGSLETRTLFASGLNLVSGLEVGHGGVWVGAAPYLLFIPDRDGDLVPDGESEVLLDGWGYQDTHETLNAFTWGPDGWLYGCHGVFTHSRVGAPGTPDEARVPINAGVWRFHPVRREFEVFAWGTSNPWGIDFDDHGEAFITACVIPHLFHVIQGARYVRQAGAHFDEHAWGELDTIADHRHWLGDSPHGGNLRSDSAGGGHAHCGAVIYLGDAFPAEHRGMLLTSNIHGNRLNRERLERSGSGFVGRHEADFLLANDAWFRGINATVGPDGNLYLIDWYDAQACHLNTPERFDRSNGRLYRIAYGPQRPVRADLPERSSVELAELALSPNDWWVRRARVELAARGDDAAARATLQSILRHNPDVTRRLRALWALHSMGALDEIALSQMMIDRDEHLRAWALRLALESKVGGPRTLSLMVRRAPHEPSSLVRLQMAAALQRLPLDARWSIAAQLVRRGEDAQDANIPLMLWWAIEPLAASDPRRALELLRGTRMPVLAQRIARRAALSDDGLEPLVQALVLERDAARRASALEGLELALRGRREVQTPASWPVLWARLSQDESARVRELALSLAASFGDPAALPRLRATVADRALPADERRRALERIARTRDDESQSLVLELLDEPELARDALRALALYEDQGVSRSVLQRYGDLDEATQREALALLVTREAWALHLLDFVEGGRVPASDLLAADLRHLRALGSAAVTSRVEARWGRVRATAGDKAEAVIAWKERLASERRPRPDVHRGRVVFEATCGVCHPLFGGGGTLGPDLSGSNRADLDYLLENLLDPSAVIPAEYLETLVWLEDGRLLSGVARRADADTLVLQTQTETHEIPRDEIEEQRESGLSIMPEGQLEALPEQDARDLIAYLAEPRQVAPLAAPGCELFDGRSLAGWRSTGAESFWSVEDGEIVARHAGAADNDFLVSELAVRDFRLTLEVRLVGDAGNGGVQFRSHVGVGGDVSGYQADVGPGWWGKLYEEHGRALLHEGAGEQHVHRDGWNRYEIEAVGSRITLRLNGATSVEIEDPDGARSGVLALQIHSGAATEIRFRDLRLEVLP